MANQREDTLSEYIVRKQFVKNNKVDMVDVLEILTAVRNEFKELHRGNGQIIFMLRVGFLIMGVMIMCHFWRLDVRLDRLDVRLDRLDVRLDRLDVHLDRLNEGIRQLNQSICVLNNNIRVLNNNIRFEFRKLRKARKAKSVTPSPVGKKRAKESFSSDDSD